jgi:hypothetical protein
MAWIELTEISGRKLYLNMEEIYLIEEYQWTGGIGSVLTSKIRDKEGRPIKFQVRETAKDIVRQAVSSATG